MQPMTLERHVDELRRSCQQLIPYSFPKADVDEESALLPLKTRHIIVDGYDVSVNLSIYDFGKYKSENIQIQGVHTPFLPFHVVCKVARAFLGSENLSCAEFVKNNRKVYCWMVRRRGKKTLRPTAKSLSGNHEGFGYAILEPGQLNLYGTKD